MGGGSKASFTPLKKGGGVPMLKEGDIKLLEGFDVRHLRFSHTAKECKRFPLL